MKIVHISDTHCLHREVEIPEGDILIHSGDITNIGELGIIADFCEWTKQLPHKYKIIIAGNHDRTLEQAEMKTKRWTFEKHGIIYLENTGTEIEGLKIWGSPVTSTIPSWSFVETRKDERKKLWEQIPDNLDILITHGPPKGIMDEVKRASIWGYDNDIEQEYIENCGDAELLAAVTLKKPRYHLFGHIHEGYGQLLTNTGTLFVNSAICDPLYRPTRKPQILNIEPTK